MMGRMTAMMMMMMIEERGNKERGQKFGKCFRG
jgi:hypothetical protein